ncbi:MAG TPA: response regulator [Blastocatellia bacterium]|nr:response regulator [Blastocatellia bacterium]
MNADEVPILIVADDEWNREMLECYLSRDYQCVTAGNAEYAMELLADSCFSMVITDLKTPGTSGFELCRVVKQMSPDTIVLIVSGANDSSCFSEARRLGAFDYLTKPIDLFWLSRTIRSALRSRSGTDGDCGSRD